MLTGGILGYLIGYAMRVSGADNTPIPIVLALTVSALVLVMYIAIFVSIGNDMVAGGGGAGLMSFIAMRLTEKNVQWHKDHYVGTILLCALIALQVIGVGISLQIGLL